MARHADLVFPATTSLERNDIGSGRADARIVAMQRARSRRSAERATTTTSSPRSPSASACARRSPKGATSAPGSSTCTRASATRSASAGIATPDVRRVLGERLARGARHAKPSACCSTRFAPIPRRIRCKTPSGKIELFSETIAGFGYDDCPGPRGLARERRVARLAAREAFPLALVANNPATRLHGQLDLGAYSQAVEGERARAGADPPGRRGGARHRRTATSCGCSTIAAAASPARCSRPTCGPAWCSSRPARGSTRTTRSAEIAMCVHGNPNVLTRDVGTSRLVAGLLRTARPGRGRALRRRRAAGARVRAAGDRAAPTRVAAERRCGRTFSGFPEPHVCGMDCGRSRGSIPWSRSEASFRVGSSRNRSSGFEANESSWTRTSLPSTPSRRALSFKR